MKDFIQSSALTRLLANIFLFLVVVASLAIATYEVWTNQPINPLCYMIVSAGATYAVSILGVHAGLQAGGNGNTSVLIGQSPPDVTQEDTQPGLPVVRVATSPPAQFKQPGGKS